jgi:hypothetical protein
MVRRRTSPYSSIIRTGVAAVKDETPRTALAGGAIERIESLRCHYMNTNR